jgi:uncharacterized protein DUF3237
MTKAISTLALLMSFAVPALAQDSKATVDVRTEYLMTIEVRFGSRTPVGQRVVINLGGSVHGPSINGEITPPAGEWAIVMPDGSSRIDARYTLKTDDGAFILLEVGGIVAFSKDAQERMGKGEIVRAGENPGYFIATPRFMTEAPKYAWLNQIQAVGKLVSIQRGVSLKYDMFVVR